MSMITVELGHCADDPRKISKTMTGIIVYSGEHVQFRDAADLHDPVFMLQDTIAADINYCKITHQTDSFTHVRYYYAEITNVRTGLSTVSCRLDVLMTYSSQILQLPVYVMRTADIAYQTPYIVDGNAPINAQRVTAPKNGYQGGSVVDLAAYGSEMILITVG